MSTLRRESRRKLFHCALRWTVQVVGVALLGYFVGRGLAVVIYELYPPSL